MNNRRENKSFKMTPQRMAILEFLDDNTSHPSAEDVYSNVKERFSTMSFSTVYKTLESLRDRGELIELTIDSERKRYDPDTVPHHHLLCSSCGDVHDIHGEFDLGVPQDIKDKYEIKSSHIEFYGYCPKCKNKGGV